MSISNLVVVQALLLSVFRETLEAYLPAKHASTAGRLMSCAQGLCVMAYMYNNNFKDGIESTMIYFVLDLVFTIKYTNYENMGELKFITMIIHHILGFLLCAYSSYTQTYQAIHPASTLTLSLLSLEMCNPVLHLSMITKYEHILLTIKPLIDISMLINYGYVRVWLLGKSILISDQRQIIYYSQYPTTFFFVFAVLLWILQSLWFIYLLKTTFTSAWK
jgi:hypothetical protein